MLAKSFSLRAYVVALFTGGNSDEDVTSILVRRSGQDSDLHRELLLLGAKQAVRTFFTDSRSCAVDTMETLRREKEDRAGLTAAERAERMALKAHRRRLLDSYALYGHKLLRDAKAADLRDSITNRRIQVAGNIKAIRFEQMILNRIKTSPDKTCRQFFEPDKIDLLWEKAHAK